jgi:hypothetical protein
MIGRNGEETGIVLFKLLQELGDLVGRRFIADVEALLLKVDDRSRKTLAVLDVHVLFERETGELRPRGNVRRFLEYQAERLVRVAIGK